MIQYIRTVNLLIEEKLLQEEYFLKAIVMTSISVLRLGIEHEDTVEISIFAM